MRHFTLVAKNFLGKPEEFDGMARDSIIGGAEINLYRTAKLLLNEGYEVTVLQEDVGLDIDSFEEIKIKYVPTYFDKSMPIKTFIFNYQWRRHVPRNSYVHIHHERYAVPFYKGIHSANQQGLAWDYPGMKKLSTKVKLYYTRKLLAEGTYVRASDNSFLVYVQSEWPLYRNQVYPIPNGVDVERFSPKIIDPEELGIKDDGRIKIIFPRTITLYRGALLFVDSLNILKKECHNFIAVFIGAHDVMIKKMVEKRIDEYNLNDNVHFVGHICNEMIQDYYNVADIVTIPTLFAEGSSISCIEAMACGKPVVVTDVGGLKELIYRDNVDGGIKVKPTPEHLAKAYKKLIIDCELRDSLGQNARQRVLKYYRLEQWQHYMKSYFKNIIKNTKISTWK